MKILTDFILFCVYSSTGYYVATCIASLWFAREAASPAPALPATPPQVVLLRPLHGYGEHILQNARALLRTDYPDRTIVFGATSEQDGSARIVRTLTQEHPSSDVIGTIGQDRAGNPKIGKLMWMLRHSPQAPVIVMSDADGRLPPGHIRRVVGELYADESIGAVTCLYRGVAGAARIGARLEALTINTDFTPTAILSKYIEPTRHAFAACIAIKKQVLDAIGGLESLRDSFGDDTLLGQKVAAAGYGVKISGAVLTTLAEDKSVGDFWRHQMRSGRVDRRTRPICLGRILINGPFWALILLLASGFSARAVALAALVVGARLVTSAMIIKRVLHLPLELKQLILIPLKDLILAGVWGASLFGKEVEWAGKQMRLAANGEMQEVPNVASPK